MIGRLLAEAEKLPEKPTQADLEPLRRIVEKAGPRFSRWPELDHRLRNIMTVTSISRSFESPQEASEWILKAIRGRAK